MRIDGETSTHFSFMTKRNRRKMTKNINNWESNMRKKKTKRKEKEIEEEENKMMRRSKVQEK